MAIEPTKVNTGNSRPVTKIDVLNAENRGVEREQLNRILSSLDSRISVLENDSSSGGGSSSGDITITSDATQINVVQSSNNYDLSLATGGVTTPILADDAVTTGKLADANVTYAKIQGVTTDRLLGRDTAGSGVVEEISLNSTLSFTGTGAIQRAALTGDVTASAGSNATTIANNAVTDAKFRQSAGLSVVGRSANSTGNVADITADTDGHVLRRSGTTLGFGTIPNTSISGLGTMSTQNATAVAITGGTATLSTLTTGHVQVTGGSFGAGRLYKSASHGTALVASAGSSYDAALFNPAGSAAIWRVPTGTNNLEFGGNTSITGTLSTTGALQVGALSSGLTNTLNGNTAIKTSNPVLRLDGATDWDLQSVDSDGRFRLLSGGSSEVLSVLSGGNVGIGTTTPISRLAVNSETLATAIVAGRGTNPSQYLALYSEAAGQWIRGFSPTSNAKFINYDATTNDANAAPTVGSNGHLFRIRGSEVVRFEDGGNVGIGTSSPSEKLSVAGNISATTTTSTGDYYQVTDVHTIDANTGTESLTVNWSNGSVQKCQRGSSFTVNTITGPSEYVANCTLYVYQSASSIVITWPSNVKFLASPLSVGSFSLQTGVYYGFWDGTNFFVTSYNNISGDVRPS